MLHCQTADNGICSFYNKFCFCSDGIFIHYYQSMLKLLLLRDEEYNSDQKDNLKHIHKSSWKLFFSILEPHQKNNPSSAIYEVHFADRFESPSEGVQSKLWPHYVLLSDNLLTSCRLSHSLCCNPLVASCFQNVPLVSCCVNSTPHFYISMAEWENLKFAGHSAESSITRSVFRDEGRNLPVTFTFAWGKR